MKKEKIDMFEILQAINETVTIIQGDLADLKNDFSDFKYQVDQRFNIVDQRLNRIEANMVQKDNFQSLVKILERKEVISKYESAHVLHPKSSNS